MKTALLVARDACARSAVCDLITPGGVRIVCARTCADALRGVERDGLRPRVVVLDLARAGAEEAAAFLGHLRGTPRLRRAQVVLLADPPTAAHDTVVRHGALGALPTDVEDWRLVQVIDRLSDRPARPRCAPVRQGTM